MEANSQFNSQLQLTSQYYNEGDQYVQMYPVTSTTHTSNVGYDSKPPALPPKPSTPSYGDQFVSKRHSRSSFDGNTQWGNNPVTSTKKFTDSSNLQWDNNVNTPTNAQWNNTATPTNSQWTSPVAGNNTQWNNTGTPQWTTPITVTNTQWNNTTPVTANQSLEVQQSRRENVMLQNEIERLRQQLQQREQQSMQVSTNDAWITQQNRQLHQQVAQLTQENDELRRKVSSMESELMVLQHSLKTHEEDFVQERRDRVRIHEEKEKLQQELESQAQVIKMLTEEHGGKLMEMEHNLGLDDNEQRPCQRCNRLLYPNEMFEHVQKCLQ